MAPLVQVIYQMAFGVIFNIPIIVLTPFKSIRIFLILYLDPDDLTFPPTVITVDIWTKADRHLFV